MASRDANISTKVETAEVPFPLARIDGSICVDDFLPYTNLSIERALRLIPLEDDPESHRNLYAWFMNETGNEGIRFHGSTLPGVKFKHVAQRGIHVPSRHRYAATVTVAYNSLYSDNNDGARVDLGDGTWILYYSAHQNNSGGTTDMHWNQKLVNCLMDGVPVGVFLQQNSSSSSYLRFLAFVEEFNPENELFTLHGPVTPETEHLFASATPQTEMGESATVDERLQTTEICDPERMEEDRRRFSVARRMVRQGQQAFRKDLFKAYEGHCAVTGFDTNEVLQAAHILDYRGTQSNIVENGILLRSDIHLLFDSYLLGINPASMCLEASPRISDGQYADLDGKKLFLPKEKALRPNENFLIAKYKRFKCCV